MKAKAKTKIEKRQMDVHLIASVPVNRQGKKQWILSMDSNMEMEISSFLVPMITLPLVQMLTSGLDPLGNHWTDSWQLRGERKKRLVEIGSNRKVGPDREEGEQRDLYSLSSTVAGSALLGGLCTG